MSERERLLRQISMVDFAILELHMFLDTHPNDSNAATKLDEYQIKSAALTHEFESKYGPLSANDRNANRWAWISNPWPWDNMSEQGGDN